MNIKYWAGGEQHSVIDPDYQSPEQVWHWLSLVFPDLEQIEINGEIYQKPLNGLEQVELLKKLHGVK